MSGLNPQAMLVLSEHHGVATLKMLKAAGVGRRAVERLIELGVLVRRHERVVRIASTPLTEESRCVEACLAYPRGFITGRTAGRLTGLRRMGKDDEVIDLCIPHGSNVGPLDGVHLRQSTKIDQVDVQLPRGDGIRIASAPRLAFDLGADLVQRDHASIVEQMLHERRCTFATMLSTARRLMHPLRPGSAVVAATLLERGQRAAAESHAEVDLAACLRAAGVPVVPQGPLKLPNGGRVRIDLAVPDIRWGVEIDLHPDHLLLAGTAKDKRRDRQCHLIGWEIERVTELDLLDLDGLMSELKALFIARATTHRAA